MGELKNYLKKARKAMPAATDMVLGLAGTGKAMGLEFVHLVHG